MKSSNVLHKFWVEPGGRYKNEDEKHTPEFCEQWGYHWSPIFPACPLLTVIPTQTKTTTYSARLRKEQCNKKKFVT